jgi:hypothetical protein
MQTQLKAEEEAIILVRIRNGKPLGVHHACESGRPVCRAAAQGVTTGTETSRGTWTEKAASFLDEVDLCGHCARLLGELELYAVLCCVTITCARVRCTRQRELLEAPVS